MRYLSFLILSVFTLGAFSQNNPYAVLAKNLGVDTIDICNTCDSVLKIRDYTVRIIKNKGEITHLGLNLFDKKMETTTDKEILRFIETGMLAKNIAPTIDGFESLTIKTGKVSDFRNVNPYTPVSINNSNSQLLLISWTLGEQKLEIQLPVSYSVAKRKDRSQIEEDFIQRLKGSVLKRNKYIEISPESIESYEAGLYIHKGPSFQVRKVTQNVYLDSIQEILWDERYPLESIANMFILSAGNSSSVPVELKISRHEYGETSVVSLSLEQLIAVAEAEGCEPFWGVESFKNDILKGSLFLYNRQMGYNHSFSIECNASDILHGNGAIKARGNLYVPINNVHNLFDDK